MSIFQILFLVLLAALTATLFMGIRNLYRQGPEARSRSNRLMRLRVALQAAAVVALMAGLWWKSTQGG